MKKDEHAHVVKPGGKNAQHEQELPPSRDFENQKEGGFKKGDGPDSKAKGKDSKKS